MCQKKQLPQKVVGHNFSMFFLSDMSVRLAASSSVGDHTTGGCGGGVGLWSGVSQRANKYLY